jgi:hypothetical protein
MQGVGSGPKRFGCIAAFACAVSEFHVNYWRPVFAGDMSVRSFAVKTLQLDEEEAAWLLDPPFPRPPVEEALRRLEFLIDGGVVSEYKEGD